MARAIYTVNVFQGHQTGKTVFGPPPGGFIWVLEALDCFYGGSTQQIVYLQGTLGQTIWANSFSALGTGQYASWRGRVVIGPGLTCALRTDVATDMTLTAYQLALP